MRRTLFFIAIILAIAISVPSAPAQSPITPDTERGVKPYGDFHGGDIDQVSLSSGKLVLNIPLISYPQRGGKIKVGFNLQWSGVVIRSTQVCNPNNDTCNDGGQRDYTAGGTLYKSDDLQWSAFTFSDAGGQSWAEASAPDGAQHYMVGVSTGNYRSTDATGLLYNSTTATLQTSDGVRYKKGGTNPTGPDLIEDPNGNKVTWNGSGWTDTLGRSIPTTSVTTTDFTGCTGSAPTASAYTYAFPAPNGGTESFKFCIANFSYSFGLLFGTNPPKTISGTIGQIQSIVLPNNTAWTFEYDPGFASLSQITLPTGGTISYTWAMQGAPCQWTTTTNHNTGTTTTNKTYYLIVTSRSVNANDGTGSHTWNYSGFSTVGSNVLITDPNLNDSVHVITGLAGTGTLYETQSKYFQGSSSTGTLLKTLNTDYTWSNQPQPAWSTGPGPALTCQNEVNVVPIRVTTTWPSGKVTKEETDYDAAYSNLTLGEVIAKREYDYASGAPGALLRQTKTTYMALSGPNSSSYLANNLISLPYTVQILNGGSAQVALTQYNYDENTVSASGMNSSQQLDLAPPTGTYRGNNSSTLRWLNSGSLTCQSGSSGGSGSNVIGHNTFFDTGNAKTTSDPCNNTTTFAYSSTYWAAFPTTVTNALSQASTHVFDLNTGLLTSSTDVPNNLTTSYTYDNMRRLASVTAPDGGVTTITHQETTFPFSATVNKPINPSQTETSTNVFDGLGRVTQTQLTSDPQGTDYTDTTYDALGRVATVSNPHRTCGTDITSSCGTTTYGYDALSRKTSETYPDSSVLTSAYCGTSTLVTDPTARWRRSRADGLGRLVEVDEPNAVGASVASTGCPGSGEPLWITNYGYDTLGNLISVLQNASHSRSFTYDSFSRMLTSANPEVGTITYGYFPDGPLHTKQDARSITTTYLYDALHRVTSAAYSNGDATVATVYDGTNCLGLSACQNVGHRTSMTDAGGSEIWAYQVDATNHRSLHKDQRTNTVGSTNLTKTATYTLDLAGNVTQAAYPTIRTVNYTYDNADRPGTAADSSNGVTYASGPDTSPGGSCLADVTCYTPQGTFYALAIGETSSFTGLNLTHIYNSRLQPQEFKASSTGGNAIDISYNFADPLNNNKNAGHVFSITNNLDTTRSQTFTYDQLNRITGALTTSTHATSPTHCWGETYTLDAWANLQSIAATTNSAYTGCSQESGFSKTADGNNHVSGFSYDASGNTSSDAVNTYTWDAESQLKVTAGTTYLYDGDGRRVAKASTAVPPVPNKFYWYGAGSDILAETDGAGNLQSEYVFFGGKRIALVPASGNPSYYVEDLLGTSRVLTTNVGAVCYDADFYPYGGERSYTNTCPQNYKFESKERDTETGNDDFGARYYSNRFGRWLSADWSSVPVAVPYANLTNPQTFNLYSMVADDPESFADLDGHDPDVKEEVSQKSYTVHGSTAEEAHANALLTSGIKSDTGEAMSGDTKASIQILYKDVSVETTAGTEASGSTAFAEVKSADVILKQTITTPTWAERENASPEQQQAWDQGAATLQKHEQGHAEINRQGAEKLDKGLPGTSGYGTGKTPGQAQKNAVNQMNKNVKKEAQQTQNQTNQKQREYDQKTDHGRKQPQ